MRDVRGAGSTTAFVLFEAPVHLTAGDAAGIETVEDVTKLRREHLADLAIQGLPDAKRYFKMLREVATASPLPQTSRERGGPARPNARVISARRRALPSVPGANRSRQEVSSTSTADRLSKSTKNHTIPRINADAINHSTNDPQQQRRPRDDRQTVPDRDLQYAGGGGELRARPTSAQPRPLSPDSSNSSRCSTPESPATLAIEIETEPSFFSSLVREETMVLTKARPTTASSPQPVQPATSRNDDESRLVPRRPTIPRKPLGPTLSSAAVRARKSKGALKGVRRDGVPTATVTTTPNASAAVPNRQTSAQSAHPTDITRPKCSSKSKGKEVVAPVLIRPESVGDADEVLGDVRIRVCVRKRPLGKRERRRNERDVIEIEPPSGCTVTAPKFAVDMQHYTQRHTFAFDQTFDVECSNEDVYRQTARPLVRCAVNRGCKVACFAYGQTGAGKTHTMMGVPGELPGLYYLGAADLFAHLRRVGRDGTTVVWASFYEIYCGKLYDLLHGRQLLHAREDGRGTIHIRGLERVAVHSADDIMAVIERGGRSRATEATGANDTSSRSHAIIQLDLQDPATRRDVGRISFIDLAGSERASDTMDNDKIRRMEGAEINTSLLALKECIRGLDQNANHVPFRQSKLTMVLKDSFVGDSRTCMIACVAPGTLSCEHTLNTVRYADRVKELSGPESGRSPLGSRGGTGISKRSSRSARSTTSVSEISSARGSQSRVSSATYEQQPRAVTKKKKRKSRRPRPEWVIEFTGEEGDLLSPEPAAVHIATRPEMTGSTGALSSSPPSPPPTELLRAHKPAVTPPIVGAVPPKTNRDEVRKRGRTPQPDVKARRRSSVVQHHSPVKQTKKEWVDNDTPHQPRRPSVGLISSSPISPPSDPWKRHQSDDAHQHDLPAHEHAHDAHVSQHDARSRQHVQHHHDDTEPDPFLTTIPRHEVPNIYSANKDEQPKSSWGKNPWEHEAFTNSQHAPRCVAITPSRTELRSTDYAQVLTGTRIDWVDDERHQPHRQSHELERGGRKRWHKDTITPTPKPMWSFDDPTTDCSDFLTGQIRSALRPPHEPPTTRHYPYQKRNPEEPVAELHSLTPVQNPRSSSPPVVAYPGPLPGEIFASTPPRARTPTVVLDPSTGRRLTKVEQAKQEAMQAFGGLALDEAATPQPKVKSVMTMKDWTPRRRQAAA